MDVKSLVEASRGIEAREREQLRLIASEDAEDRRRQAAVAADVRRQLQLGETICAFRVHLQKVLTTANRIPPRPLFDAVIAGGDGAEAAPTAPPPVCTGVAKAAEALTTKLLALLANVSEAGREKVVDTLKNNKTNAPSMDTDGDVGACNRGGSAEKVSAKRAWALVDVWPGPLKRHCLRVADEWKTKTQVEIKRGFRVMDQVPSAQLRHAMLDATRLVRRSQPTSESIEKTMVGGAMLRQLEQDADRRLAAAPEGKETTSILSDVAANFFDDQDFYVQLLRDATNMAVGAHRDNNELFVQTRQDMLSRNHSKAHRTNEVDRRASKGRRIRYTPIPKLENFMSAFPPGYHFSQSGQVSDPLVIDRLMQSLFR
eukprot:GHVT01100611.1.p1 GENE.GHVT01100611.1~~GHVT01100611.1.p1  ORF type:complete len:372 (-),score=62.98 GHVT01100611.1:150-1265(-)